MSVTNNAVMFALGNNQGQAAVELVGGPAATQNTATRINNQIARVTKAVATGSFQLPSMLNGEANELIWVVNDTAVTINVYPAVGEKTNGGTNTAFQITTGLTGVFIPVLASPNNYPSTLDWRCALIP